MLAVYANGIVKTPNQSKFIELAKQLIEATRNEKGNISYELIQGIDNSEKFAFLEKWESQEALDLHMETPHFTSIVPLLGDLLENGLDIVVHKVVV